MNEKIYDIIVIGGGINGAGIAREASERGLSVALIEARDLAAATSSASTKLIHGGLRYLEYFQFGLVRSSLREREALLKTAPHLVRPLKFILPPISGMRPGWMIRAGLFLYDLLAGRTKIPASGHTKLSATGLKDTSRKGFFYYDCQTDDARLVVLNAVAAAEKSADIFTYTKCTRLEETAAGWIVHLENQISLKAKKIINAAGPFAADFLAASHMEESGLPALRLVKGSHIVTKRLYPEAQAFLLQQPGGRIVFVIPYEDDFTLIGTTEEDYTGDPYAAQISEAEKDYLIAAHNRAFGKQISGADIVWHYSGVRPLIEDGSKDAKSVTRDYRLHLHQKTRYPLLSVFGGKLTTYRALAENALNIIDGKKRSRTATTPLPGGAIEDFDDFLARQIQKYPQAPEALLRRYARCYGTRMDMILNADQGAHYGDDIYEAEIAYLIAHEFAVTLEDILWRRSKLGLHISAQTLHNLQERFS